MILCLVDLDICDKVLSPCQTEAFLTVQSLFIHLFFFLHFSCLQFATMSDSILSRRKLARPQFWYQFSSLISWRWRRRPAYLMPNLLHLLLDIQRRCEACSWTVYSRLVLTVHATCQPFRKMIIKRVSICTLVISHPLPEGLLLFLRSIAPIRLLSFS